MTKKTWFKISGVFLALGLILNYAAEAAPSKIEIRKNDAGGYTLFVRSRPFLIKGVGYSPTPIGQGYEYDLFLDENKPWLTDGKLMKQARINAVRIYAPSPDVEKMKEFIDVMYKKFGIYTIMSDWIGLWDYPHPNYADRNFREKTKKRILSLAASLKDRPGFLMWILGNENNYTFSSKPGYPFWTSPEIEKIDDPRQKQEKKAEIYYSFINDLAREIKKIDAVHPVALGNGEASFLDTAAKVCKDIDVLAIIIYQGKRFGNLFNNVRRAFERPIVLSEFGCDSYDAFADKEDQKVQAEFILSQWQGLYANTALGRNRSGNALGGCLFEWNDEWWKHNEGYTIDWDVHNTEAGWPNGAYFFDNRAKDGRNMNEEWFGIVSLKPEKKDNLNERIPKQAYHTLRAFLARPTTAQPKRKPSRRRR